MKRRASTSSASSGSSSGSGNSSGSASSSSANNDPPLTSKPPSKEEVAATKEEQREDEDEDEPFDPPPELVSAYEQLMRDRVEVSAIQPVPLPPSDNAPSKAPANTASAADDEAARAQAAREEDAKTEAALGRPMTKAEKQNAKKKRRKERERAMKAAMEAVARKEEAPPPPKSDIVVFPLFAEPIPVNLDDTEYYEVTKNPRLTPLTPTQRAYISRLAAEAEWAHEHYPNIPVPISEPATIYTKAKVLPPSFVAHFPESKLAKGHGWSHINVFLPHVQEEEQEEPAMSKSKRRKMRRQNSAWREVQVGELYRSGKANGYGWNF